MDEIADRDLEVEEKELEELRQRLSLYEERRVQIPRLLPKATALERLRLELELKRIETEAPLIERALPELEVRLAPLREARAQRQAAVAAAREAARHEYEAATRRMIEAVSVAREAFLAQREAWKYAESRGLRVRRITRILIEPGASANTGDCLALTYHDQL